MFDIDKIYLMFPELKTIKKYDYKKANDDFYEEYPEIAKNINKNYIKVFYNWLAEVKGLEKEALDKEELKALKEEFKEYNKEQNLKRKDYYNLNKDLTLIDEKDNDALILFDEFFNKNKEKYYTHDKLIKVKYNHNKSIKDNSKVSRDNLILDIMFGILTNIDTTAKVFNPGSFDEQKRTARKIQIIKNSNYTYDKLENKTLKELDTILQELNIDSSKNLLDSNTQIYFHKQNMTASKLIGIFANHNTSHALLQLQNINFNLENEIVFNGVNFNDIRENSNDDYPARLDLMYALDGITYITKTIAGFLAASVDAVKDPVLNHLNLNTFTANVSMVLARLGFDSDSIGLLLANPIIEELTDTYTAINNEGFSSGIMVINDFIDNYLSKLGLNSEIKQEKIKTLKENKFTKEFLAKNLKNGDPQDQLDILLLFSELYKKGELLNDLTYITKFDTSSNAAGPLIANTLSKIAKVNKFFDKVSNPKTYTFGKETLNVIENSPIIKSFYEGIVNSNELLGEFFPHLSSDAEMLIEYLQKDMVGTLSPELLDKILNHFFLYKLTAQDGFLDMSFDKRKEMTTEYVNKFESYKTDDRYKDLFETNTLLKAIRIKGADRRIPFRTLSLKTGSFGQDKIDVLKNAWSDLPQELAQELFMYNIYKVGFMFDPNSFIHLTPLKVKLDNEKYINSLRRYSKYEDKFIPNGNQNVFDLLSRDQIINFIVSIKRNLYETKSITPEVELTKKDYIDLNNGIIEITNKKIINSLKVDVDHLDNKVYNKVIFINFKDNNKGFIGVNISNSSTSNSYQLMPVLGNKNSLLEISMNTEDTFSSIIDENNRGNVIKNKSVGDSDNSMNLDDKIDSMKNISAEEILYIKELYQKLIKIDKETINKEIGHLTDKRSKVIKLLRTLRLDDAAQKKAIQYFKDVELRDDNNEIIC